MTAEKSEMNAGTKTENAAVRAGRGRKLPAALCAAALLLVSAAALLIRYFAAADGLPDWIEWKNAACQDAGGVYEIRLHHRTVHVSCQGQEIWTSPDDIPVQDVLSCDVDHDGADELALLCWRVGKYGRSRPFWVSEDEEDETWSQHLLVLEYGPDTLRSKWMSSDMGFEAVAMSAGVLTEEEKIPAANHPGQTYLFFLERNGKTSSWIWESWGFTKIDTGDEA